MPHSQNMACKVVLLSTALKDLSALSSDARTRIAAALRELQEFPNDRGIKKLKPPMGGFRKRVGDYRILFDVDGSTLSVYRIKNRKDAYR